jgi:hypothetical protein
MLETRVRIGMRVRALFIIAVVVVSSTTLRAQISQPGDAMATVKTVADRLGMLRSVQPPGGTLRGVDGILFLAKGTIATPRPSGPWPISTVMKLTTEVTYFPYSQGIAVSPGIRWDFTLVGTDGKPQRKVLAAAGIFGWNQTDLDGPATPAADAVDERLREIWMTPQGLIWAALTPDGKGLADGVTVSKERSHVVLTIPQNGDPMKVTLNEQNRPAKVEARVHDSVLGDTTLEVTYAGYRDFENAYGVFFPAIIIEKLGGRTVLDVTVSEFHSNPYIVFPVPANVREQETKQQ